MVRSARVVDEAYSDTKSVSSILSADLAQIKIIN
jgi:hypothetical protein